MENYYTSYTKKIQNITYYFVKKFVIFPEFKDVPPVLEGFGMHTDFDRACAIAAIDDGEIKINLLKEIENHSSQQARVIDFNEMGFGNKKAAGL